MANKNYLVKCEISGTCYAYVEAKSEEEAIRLVSNAEWDDVDIHEWKVEDVIKAELNE